MKSTIVACAITATIALSGCAYKVDVMSQSGAGEIMATKMSKDNAVVVVGADLAALNRDVKASYLCGAHVYPMFIGTAISRSLSETVEAAYKNTKSGAQFATKNANGIVFKFDLADFDPRLRFSPGFWVPTADANVDIGIRAHISDGTGKELLTTTFRGQGHASVDGGCDAGAQALELAAEQAIRTTMEGFVDKVINTSAIDANR